MIKHQKELRNSMDEDLMNTLISELRDEGIPPYCSYESLLNYIKHGDAELRRYVYNIDYDKDQCARGFLKNYVWYAFNKVTNEFFINYGPSLTSWQFSLIGDNNV